jgi:hypothetical protein
MPRISPAARAAAAWRTSGQKPPAPKHMSAKAKRIWQTIVDDRPTDWFRPGSLLLLEQLCSVMVAQRELLPQLERAPDDADLIKAAAAYANIINMTATKLRLTVQADVEWHSRKTDEKEAAPNALLGGWAPGKSAAGKAN